MIYLSKRLKRKLKYKIISKSPMTGNPEFLFEIY
jgi:hypothetical protein